VRTAVGTVGRHCGSAPTAIDPSSSSRQARPNSRGRAFHIFTRKPIGAPTSLFVDLHFVYESNAQPIAIGADRTAEWEGYGCMVVSFVLRRGASGRDCDLIFNPIQPRSAADRAAGRSFTPASRSTANRGRGSSGSTHPVAVQRPTIPATSADLAAAPQSANSSCRCRGAHRSPGPSPVRNLRVAGPSSLPTPASLPDDVDRLSAGMLERLAPHPWRGGSS